MGAFFAHEGQIRADRLSSLVRGDGNVTRVGQGIISDLKSGSNGVLLGFLVPECTRCLTPCTLPGLMLPSAKTADSP